MSHNAPRPATRRFDPPDVILQRPRTKIATGPTGRIWAWNVTSIGAGATSTHQGPWLPAGSYIGYAHLTISARESLLFQKLVAIQEGEIPEVNMPDILGGWTEDARGIVMNRLDITINIGRLIVEPTRIGTIVTNDTASGRTASGLVTIFNARPVDVLPQT